MPSGTAGIAAGKGLSAATVAFANKRKISRATLERFDVGSATVFFPELDDEAEAILFGYSAGWKARALGKKAFVSQKGFKLEFWNLAAVTASSNDTVYITEGELDACALVEAGIDAGCVLSVPNGAKARGGKDKRNGSEYDTPDELRGYEFVQEALASGLGEKRKFVWCGDRDGAGLSLRADMAKLIGPARFYFVDWPDGCKDANEVLQTDGAAFLSEMVRDGHLPWPVAGLYRMSELPEMADVLRWSTGMVGWDGKVMIAPRTLSVVTGQPGHGKTLIFGQIFFNIVRAYNLCACVASFETRPKPHLRRQLRSLHCGALERLMNDDEKIAADRFIEERYLFMLHPDQRPDIRWFLDTAEVAVVRHGARILQLDPWNRLEAMRGDGETETGYIARCLREMHAFAADLDCHVQVIAHPAKMEGKLRKQPPMLEDIAGSKAWDAMADQGFTIHRPTLYDTDGTRRTEAELYHRKARFEELGYQCRLRLKYHLETGCYEVDTTKAKRGANAAAGEDDD